jgi:hypothetical protein
VDFTSFGDTEGKAPILRGRHSGAFTLGEPLLLVDAIEADSSFGQRWQTPLTDAVAAALTVAR